MSETPQLRTVPCGVRAAGGGRGRLPGGGAGTLRWEVREGAAQARDPGEVHADRRRRATSDSVTSKDLFGFLILLGNSLCINCIFVN